MSEGVQLGHLYGALSAEDIENGEGSPVEGTAIISSSSSDDVADGTSSPKAVVSGTPAGQLGGSGMCGTFLSVAANTVNALLGVSIFAVPWGFEQAGLLGGAAIIFLVAPLSYETARVLLVAQRMIYQATGQVKSYPEIAGDVLGKNWAVVVKSATVISCLGGCVGYLIFLGEVCGQLFNLPLEKAILAAVVPLMLLSWIRSFRDLAVFTIIGVFAIIVSCGVVIIDGMHAMKSQSPSMQTPPELFSPRSAPNFLGPATFLYTIHYCVLSLGAETLHQQEALAGNLPTGFAATPSALSLQASTPGQQRKSTVNVADVSISRPLALAYGFSSLLIILVGSSGYFTYGSAEFVTDSEGEPQPGCENHVCQNVVLNLSPGPLRNFAGCALVVAIVLSYVVILAPAREHIELIVVKYFNVESWASANFQGAFVNFIRSSVVLATALVAVMAPYFGTVLGAVGGLTDALQSFVLPPLIALKLLHHRGPLTQYFYRGVVVWGLCTIFYTLLHGVRNIYFALR